MRTTVLCGVLGLALAGAAQAQDLPEAPEKALVQRVCTTCHAASQVTAERKAPDQWAETVEKMVGMGAKVGSDAEAAQIVAYLSRYYGPAKP